MTQDEIVEMAEQAGFVTNEIKSYVISPYTSEDQNLYEELEAFAKLVAEKAIKEALSEPEQEPVGQLLEDAFGRGQVMWFNKPVDGSYVYTTPPQRTWAMLTDEEIKSCWNWETDCQEWAIEFARAILKKAQEK